MYRNGSTIVLDFLQDNEHHQTMITSTREDVMEQMQTAELYERLAECYAKIGAELIAVRRIEKMEVDVTAALATVVGVKDGRTFRISLSALATLLIADIVLTTSDVIFDLVSKFL